jgi:inhibitor of KinA sporulation pathway (predicted exonuclease)
MAKKLDVILIVDVEATCWQGAVPEGQQSEIIEIGVCALDVLTGACVEKESLLVKPVRSSISPFCTELTTLTQEQVDTGVSFQEACDVLRDKYSSMQRVWASYGEYDRNAFQKQCAATDVPYPFNSRHLNVKTLFSLIAPLPYEVGMAQALRILNLPLEGTHHRGADDAWNIAKILSRLLLGGRAGFPSEGPDKQTLFGGS